ncbi:methionine aminotransferase [Sphingobacterium spiritivorum]|uniref:methionine aminotransferase n=1 Tax=Sphingobacterium spiritivorum TaxID=258 RepID=UPI001918EB14|nr:methionine aminotransferase [Sphingobacterium spiritivorum]QQT27698.1 aminotransferase class I/II-fold pyridoxal phosphate-dependent enzyme [Sphingobacterium spiritivorum]
MSIHISSKLPNVGTTIFTRMSALAQQYGALNLSQGFPDYAPDPQLLALVEQSMRDGHHQYAMMAGVPPLRERIASKVEQLYRVTVDSAEEITVTAGGTQAIFTAIASTISPGDEVIIFEPAYDCYRPAIELFGGKACAVRLLAPDFEIDWDYVKEQITDKTKMIIINNPNNPTGRVLQTADFTALCHIVRGTGILIISDEVYEHIVYDGGAIHSLLEYEELRNRSFIIASFGKLLHTTGWKVGYCIGPAELTKEFRKVHQFNVFSVNTPMQYAIAKYLEDPQTYLSLPSFFQEKRDFLAEGLKDTGFEVIPSQGTYFLNVCYSRISTLPEEDFAVRLTKDNGIAMIPVSAFYSTPVNQQLLRICFAKKAETLSKALDLLRNIR